MDEISRAFSDDHRRCDGFFIAVEQAVTDGEWAAVEAAAARFVDAMEHHFSLEEGELFQPSSLRLPLLQDQFR